MPNNVAASMTASIVIDKSDLLAQIKDYLKVRKN